MLSAAVICEIDPPGADAKIQIIQNRLKHDSLGELPGDIVRYLADAAEYTVAQLIGVARKALLRCLGSKEAPHSPPCEATFERVHQAHQFRWHFALRMQAFRNQEYRRLARKS
jgi:chromosomal replication initiation ATPase DnaA